MNDLLDTLKKLNEIDFDELRKQCVEDAEADGDDSVYPRYAGVLRNRLELALHVANRLAEKLNGVVKSD